MYNTGQSAVVVKDLTGKEYPAIAAVNRKRRVNGQREISLSFLYTEINKDFIHELDFHWKVLFGGEWYTVINPGKSTDGDYLQVNVTAVLSFFVDLNGYYLQDKVENKSMTPANFFTELFKGTPYNFVLANNLPANTLSYEDNQSKTERFLYGIDRFAGEFIVRGYMAYIHDLIGSDKDIILHEDLNVRSVSIDVDASGFHTWAKGFGDLPEGEDADYKLKVEYKSPLVAAYGLIEGPAIKDGNYKIAANLTEAVKNQVENSYLISSEIDAIDLSNNGYPEMVLEEGDRVWLYVSKLNLNQQVRVVEIDETFDWEGNLINAKYTVGNEGIAERYKTQQYDTLKDFKDILSGKKKINVDWLPDAIKRASDIINGNLDSHFKYGAGEIIGINRNNPNGYMRFNTDGLGFSRDGGKTYRSAITYEGIVADAITTGTLRGVVIQGNDIIGNTISGGRITGTSITGSYFYNEGPEGWVRINEGRISALNFFTTGDGAFHSSTGYVVLRSPDDYVFLQSPTEVRATKPRTYDQFVDFRAGEIFAENGIYNKGTYKGDNNTLYGSDRGHVTLRSVSWNQVYLQGSEVNCTAPAQPDNYIQIKASSFRSMNGAFLGVGDTTFTTGSSSGLVALRSGADSQPVYVQGNEIRATLPSSAGSYVAVRAASFPTGSSAVFKTNIEKLSGDIIGMLKDVEIYTYHLQANIDSGEYYKPKIGMISEATLPIFRDENGVDPYTVASFLFKVCQLQQKSIETLTQRVNDLEMVG